MGSYQLQQNTITRRVLIALYSVAIATALAQPAQAHPAPLPPMPPNLEAPAGNKLYLIGHATGMQQYMCLFTGSAFSWAFFGPQATVTVTDTQYVAPGAIPWLLLQVVGAQPGPTGGEKLTRTTYIQRLNTAGGVAPSTGCAGQADIGKKALVPYTTDYWFYKAAGDKTTEDE